MATSRRRERELARRRYERRRMREMERRAKQRRRNTIIGASVGTVVVIVGIVLLAVNLSGSDNKKTSALATPPATPTPTASVSPTPPPPAPTKCATIKPNPPAKGQPTIPQVTGKAPTKLVIKDVKVGHGRAARKGDTVSVLYIGASCSDGSIFDASYKHGNQPFPVKPLGTAQVIAGWNKGLIGVKPGGIRELVIPASLGYGATGQPPIKPNETLIFLITVKSVKA